MSLPHSIEELLDRANIAGKERELLSRKCRTLLHRVFEKGRAKGFEEGYASGLEESFEHVEAFEIARES